MYEISYIQHVHTQDSGMSKVILCCCVSKQIFNQMTPDTKKKRKKKMVDIIDIYFNKV